MAVTDALWVSAWVGWIPLYLVGRWLFDPLDGKWSLRGDALREWADADSEFRWN